MLQLTKELIDAFNKRQIIYCHWKSNFSLSKALSGEQDLDLLIPPNCLAKGIIVLKELGFKSATLSRGVDNTPGVCHYYGLDHETGQWVHVHLFARILTGESLIKSHQFPFEAMLLDNPEDIQSVRVPSRDAELVLFVLRTFIKYGSLLDVIYLVRNRKELEEESTWLSDSADRNLSVKLLREHCAVMADSLFIECLDCLRHRKSVFAKVMLAVRVRRALKPYSRTSAVRRIFLYTRLLAGYSRLRVLGNRRRKILEEGGVTIAIVGPDGAGKSTIVDECTLWLGRIFTTTKVHAGRPSPTWITWPIWLVKFVLKHSQIQLSSNYRRSVTNQSDADKLRPVDLGDLIFAIRAVALAWDRYSLAIKIRRAASEGEIVISDRYPSDVRGAMDSPRLQERMSTSGYLGALYNWLARMETSLYRRILPPDIVLNLTVSVETAKRRNRQRATVEEDAYVEARHYSGQTCNVRAVRFYADVNTDRCLADTYLDVKRSIWAAL